MEIKEQAHGTWKNRSGCRCQGCQISLAPLAVGVQAVTKGRLAVCIKSIVVLEGLCTGGGQQTDDICALREGQ